MSLKVVVTVTITLKIESYAYDKFSRDAMEPAKFRICLRISCAKSLGCRCWFVARSKL